MQNQEKSIWSQWYYFMETNRLWNEKHIEKKIALKCRIVVHTNLFLRISLFQCFQGVITAPGQLHLTDIAVYKSHFALDFSRVHATL